MPERWARVGRFAEYLKFCRGVRLERGERCEFCGRSAPEAGEKRLSPHHILPIARTGVDDPLATVRVNVFLLCGYCHKLQHPGKRSWPWDATARRRGRDLR
jgi:hypothetical protein